jgi:hypothetical protein
VLQNLLEVVHDLFEEQTSLEKVTLKIMQRAQRLLKCEHAAVLLLDENADTVKFSKLFELTSPAHSTSFTRYVFVTDIRRYTCRFRLHVRTPQNNVLPENLILAYVTFEVHRYLPGKEICYLVMGSEGSGLHGDEYECDCLRRCCAL